MLIEGSRPQPWDARRQLVIPGDQNQTITFCLEHLLTAYEEAIRAHGRFFIALSGGSTPKAIYERLTSSSYAKQAAKRIDWSKIELFWSDERSCPPDHPDSNYHMAMEAGFQKMAIPPSHIHRMCAEKEIEKNAELYEKTIQEKMQGRGFDYMMLGMGEDGHTASLFPHTEGLKSKNRQVIANYIPQKNTWRMTLTFDCINRATHIVVYVLGASKKQMLAQVLSSPDQFDLLPSQQVGTRTHQALWIADKAAAALLASP